MYTNEEFIFNAIKAGAKGYLPKNTTRQELLSAIEAVSQGQEYFSETVSEIMLKSYVRIAKDDEKFFDKKDASLTIREIEILKLFANGLSNQEIADKLFISIRTVESHKNHIMQKLDLKTSVDMVKYALRNKIAEL
jgi:DNA-binding NarL/FixJ family response regulator